MQNSCRTKETRLWIAFDLDFARFEVIVVSSVTRSLIPKQTKGSVDDAGIRAAVKREGADVVFSGLEMPTAKD